MSRDMEKKMFLFGKNDDKERMKKEIRELYEKTQLRMETANTLDTKQQLEGMLVIISAIWVLLGGKV